MPRLSPTMTSGRLLRWRVSEREPLPEGGMEPIFDVLPTGLTDSNSEGSDDPINPVLEIESHEEGWLAKILVHENEEAAPDAAVAVIVCDREDDVDVVRDAYSAPPMTTAKLVVEPATFAWQAYLGSGQDAKQCSNS